jgi:hypothetical protein
VDNEWPYLVLLETWLVQLQISFVILLLELLRYHY